MENNKKYLIGVCAHINTENKFNQLVKQLEHLKEEGLDICLSINSDKYLSDLIPYVKYLVYHGNNDPIDQQFYLENSDLCNNTEGSVHYFVNSSLFYCNYRIPFRGHSKPAFKLWTNSFYTAWQNGYEWICHIEYDVKAPLMGWKNYFEEVIRDLEESNNKALYYVDNGTLWGLSFVINSSICENKILKESRKVNTKLEWIGFWGTTVTESCLDRIIKDEFKDSVIVKDAGNPVNDIWGENSWEVNQSSGYDVKNDFDYSLVNMNEPEVIHIYPSKKDNDYELHLLHSCSNIFSTTVEIINTVVKYDDQVIYHNPRIVLNSGYWHIFHLPSSAGITRITLSYEKKVGEITIPYSESFLTEKIEHIWKNTARMEMK